MRKMCILEKLKFKISQGTMRTYPSPRTPWNQKGPLDGIVKIFKMTQNNMMMEELTVSIYSQQFEDLTFQNFSRALCRRTSLKPLCHFNIG